jgi:hypothetical protein
MILSLIGVEELGEAKADIDIATKGARIPA